MAYQYEPIDAEGGEIRTLTLLPGAPTDPVRITIEPTRLFDNSWEAPAFEALSYVWGKPSTEGQATVAVASRNGADPDTTIAITSNLATCLPYLRYRRRPRVLWIDTICINQSDLVEKGYCVKRMAELYNHAARVLIWLGTEADSSTEALRTLRWLGSQVIVNWKQRSMMLASSATQDDLDELILRELPIFLLLLERPWFERLWVQQEAKLARHAQVLCGGKSIDWQVFRNALFCLWHLSQRKSLPGDVVERMNRFYILIEKTSFLLNELIFHGKARKCTNPRDRVYALLGLLGGRERKLNIEPDYTKTPSQVYQDVVAQYLKNLRRLDPIACCEPADNGTGVPTWVPDWDKSRKSTPFHLKRHPPTFAAQATIQDQRMLCAKGVQVTTVREAIPLDIPSDASLQDIARRIEIIAPHARDSWSKSHDQGSFLETFCRTIVAAHFRDRWNPPDGQEAIESDCRELMKLILDGKTLEDDLITSIPTATRCLTLVRMYSTHRSFLLADDGRFALGPRSTRPGDVICMLLGCKAPFVLQPAIGDAKGSGGTFTLAGECYLDSIMAGQPFLGPLPDHITNVTSFESIGDTFMDSFRDETTLKYQREDPRLIPVLGSGYHSKFTDMDERQRAVEAAALEVLEKREVQLREFCIV